jgi:hypothetical protein
MNFARTGQPIEQGGVQIIDLYENDPVPLISIHQGARVTHATFATPASPEFVVVPAVANGVAFP